MNLNHTAESINILARFLGMRDIPALTPEELQKQYSISKADLIILFGGSIPSGCDIAGEAVKRGIAHQFMIVGGEGHTTESLRQKIKAAYPQIETDGKMEADVMSSYIELRYGIQPDLLERNSTNCGNNVTNTLRVLHDNRISPKSILLVQDSTMQRRMDAGFRKYLDEDTVTLINFASYQAEVAVHNNRLTISPSGIWGMWDINRYVTLLMGEIPRLIDTADGYGPNGQNFIAHVDIPEPVIDAFQYLRDEYGAVVRNANPQYASK